jgi:putative DNA-binding protein
MPGNLREVQGLLYRLITAREGVSERLGVEFHESSEGIDAIVRGDERLSAIERLDIYATAYFYRLLDCLKEDFPATLAVVGADNFQRLVADYLVKFPPTQPSIFYAGRSLADFVRGHQFSERWPFMEDLVRLERATIEVFHGPDATPLDVQAMRLVPPEQWPRVALRRHPASTILDQSWKVTDVLRAVNEGRDWSEPPKRSCGVLVFRKDAQVYFREIDAVERRALDKARETINFAAICEIIASGTGAADPAAEINRLLQRWLGDGVLVAAACEPESQESKEARSDGLRPTSAKRRGERV